MRWPVRAVVWRLTAIVILGGTWMTAAAASREFPEWAYPGCAAATPSADAHSARALSVPGSALHFTRAQIQNRSITSDWFPQEHAPLPAVLAGNPAPGKIACGYCHLPDGSGRPENAKLAGLPAAYIIAQVKALQARHRQAAKPDWVPSQLMLSSIALLADDAIATAADYFSHQSEKSFVRVVERNNVPDHAVGCFIFAAVRGNTVPLGGTILEMPDEVERFELRDPHTNYVAYVPEGSIERGRLLARTGDHGRTQPCAICHGLDLKGGASVPAPPLAGRFATYLFRQLYGFQTGARGGDSAMQAVVARLTQADMIDLAAYAASLHP
jgi:cytochrome c553